MNLGELMQLMGDVTDDSNHNTYPPDQKIRLLNWAMRELWPKVFNTERKFYIKFDNLNIEAETYLYDFPANSTRMVSYIRNDDGRNLEIGNYERFDITIKERPIRYDIVGNKIYVNPTPVISAIFPYAYYYFPPKMENSTDEAFFPYGFETLIVLKAVLLGHLKTDESQGDPGAAFNEAWRSFKDTYDPHPDAPRGITAITKSGRRRMVLRDRQTQGEFL